MEWRTKIIKLFFFFKQSYRLLTLMLQKHHFAGRHLMNNKVIHVDRSGGNPVGSPTNLSVLILRSEGMRKNSKEVGT